MNYELTIKLIRSVSLFRKKYVNYLNEELKNIDLTNPEFGYLKEVILCDGISQDLIIKNLSVDKAGATRVAQSLEKKKLILRKKNNENKKFFNVFLTEKGREYIPIIKNILNNLYDILNKDKENPYFNDLISLFKTLNEKF